MKIVLIGPVYPYRGGIAHYTAQLTQALQEHGHDVLVISFRRQYPAGLYPGSSDQDPSQETMKVEAEYLLDPIYPWTWIRATKRIKTYEPDMVVFQWWTTFWTFAYSSIEASLQGGHIPYKCIIHNVLPHEQRRWDRALARIALGKGQPLIVQNEYEKERLLGLIPGARIRICHHPIYSQLSRQGFSRMEARQKLRLPENNQILLFFGIVRPYKGLNILLESLSQLRLRGLKPYLVVAGEFWEDKDIYLKQIDGLRIKDQVRIVDHYLPNEEAHLFFIATDVLVAPYTAGTQSGAAALAIGYNLPIITTRRIAAGIPDRFLKQVIAVPEGDSEALAQAIQEELKVTGSQNIHNRQTDPTVINDDWGRLVAVLEEIN